MAKFTKKALAIATASFNSDTAAQVEENLLKKYARGGAISATDTRAIKLGRIASRMDFTADADGFNAAAAVLDKKVKDRTLKEKKAYDAAGSALTRLLKRLGLKSGDARGRVPGTTMPPKDAQEAAQEAAEGGSEGSDVVEPQEAAQAPLGDLKVPSLGSVAETDLMLRNIAAFIAAAKRKHPKAFDSVNTKAVRAIVAASDQLAADRRDTEIAH